MRPARLALVALLCTIAVPASIEAHETRPGFLELRQTGTDTYSLLWKKPSGGEIEIYIAPIIPPGCQLTTAGDQALTPGALIVRGSLRCAGGINGQVLAIDGLETTITDVLVRIHHADGRLESHLLKPMNPSVTLGAQTTRWQRGAIACSECCVPQTLQRKSRSCSRRRLGSSPALRPLAMSARASRLRPRYRSPLGPALSTT